MLTAKIKVVLVKTRFPENIGMVARACANMGCAALALVMPERWDMEKAIPLATRQGVALLENMKIYSSLKNALADCNQVYGSTARIGGWRVGTVSPRQAAINLKASLNENEKAALVFGPEDKGLNNEEIALCGSIIHIRTNQGAGSLNLAQSVLIALYECFQQTEECIHSEFPENHRLNLSRISSADLFLLEEKLKKIMCRVDALQGKNPDYFFRQWHRLLHRAQLRRHEFDALMGFCRQIENKIKNCQDQSKNHKTY